MNNREKGIDTTNKFMVSARGVAPNEQIIIMLNRPMSRNEVVNLVAWLLAIADLPLAAVAETLEAVEQT